MHKRTTWKCHLNIALAVALLLGGLGASRAHAMGTDSGSPDGLIGVNFGGGPGPNLVLGAFGALPLEGLPIAVTGRGGAHGTTLLHQDSKEFVFFEPGLALVGRTGPLTLLAGVGFGVGHEHAKRCPLLATSCPAGREVWVTSGSVAAHALVHNDGLGFFFGLGLRGQTFAFRDFAPLVEAVLGAAF